MRVVSRFTETRVGTVFFFFSPGRGGVLHTHRSVGEHLVVRRGVVELRDDAVEQGVRWPVEYNARGPRVALLLVVQDQDDGVAPPPHLVLGGEEEASVSASGRTCAQSDAETLSPPPAPRRPCAPRSRPLTTWLLGPLIRCACSWLTRAALRGEGVAEATGGEGTATKSGSCSRVHICDEKSHEKGATGPRGILGGIPQPLGVSAARPRTGTGASRP